MGARRQSFLLETLLIVALIVRCVPRFGAREAGAPGEGGEGGMSDGSGGTRAGKGGGSSASGGGSGEAGDLGSSTGGNAGSASGARGGAGGSTSGASTSGGSGVAGTTGGGSGADAGNGGTSAGSGGSGTVRPCGTGGAPYAWANYCLPNHPGQGPYPQSYDTTTNGVVRDLVTGLVWEHPANGAFDQRTFADRALHCADLSSASYGGYDDWRVPTLIELVSLTDYGVFAPAIDTVAFPNTPVAAFWTDSTYVSPSQAWEVDSEYGVVAPIDVTTVANVRCVR